jgi:hypothetical protein
MTTDAALVWFGEGVDADWDAIRLDVSEYRHRGDRATALGRLIGTARRRRLELSGERAWAATFRQGKAGENDDPRGLVHRDRPAQLAGDRCGGNAMSTRAASADKVRSCCCSAGRRSRSFSI